MKRPFSFSCPVQHSCLVSILLLLTVATATTFIAGCGSSGAVPPGSPVAGEPTNVVLLTSSTANDQLFNYWLQQISTITLTNRAGKNVSLLNASQKVEFIHSNGVPAPLLTVSVPQDVYTSAALTYVDSSFSCVTINSGNLYASTYADSLGTQSAAVSLPSPITVSGTSMGLLLDLQASQSASIPPGCYQPNFPAYSITPTFNLSAITIASQPSNASNGKLTGIDGMVASTNATGFTLLTADNTFNGGGTITGQPLSINASSSTVYQGISGLSALNVGTFVDMDVAIQSDGSLVATRITVEDPAALNVVIGTVFQVCCSNIFNVFALQDQGATLTNEAPYTVGAGTTFRTSGQFTDLQNLPFPAQFDGSSIVAGQNVYVSSLALQFVCCTWTPATTVTLMPQTINGTVTRVSSSGGYQVYTVALASYNLFPTLAAQPLQTNILSNPGTVVVYVGNNTQMLNSTPLSVGSLLRFNGLIFDDNGTLRMDCAQVNDGVAE